MSQQLSSNPQPVQKRKFDVYTMMLILSFFAIVLACVLMAYELSKWGDSMWKTPNSPTATSMNVISAHADYS